MSRFLEQYEKAGCDVRGVMDRFMSDEELLWECLQQFMGENDFSNLQRAAEQGDYKEAFEYAHAIKGIVGNLGIQPVYLPVCRLVESLRNMHTENVAEELKAVMDAYAVFTQHYNDMI